MEEERPMTSAPIGSRQLNLKKSFKLGIRSLLSACSKEEFCKAFPNFTVAEQARLHRLFIEVITSLHEIMEDAFESMCLQAQAGTVLDTVEQHVEEQNLDPLFAEKSNIGAVGKTISDVKKDEIRCLMDVLKKAEEQKHLMSTRLDFLKKTRQDFSGAAAVVDKLKVQVPGVDREKQIIQSIGSQFVLLQHRLAAILFRHQLVPIC